MIWRMSSIAGVVEAAKGALRALWPYAVLAVVVCASMAGLWSLPETTSGSRERAERMLADPDTPEPVRQFVSGRHEDVSVRGSGDAIEVLVVGTLAFGMGALILRHYRARWRERRRAAPPHPVFAAISAAGWEPAGVGPSAGGHWWRFYGRRAGYGVEVLCDGGGGATGATIRDLRHPSRAITRIVADGVPRAPEEIVPDFQHAADELNAKSPTRGRLDEG